MRARIALSTLILASILPAAEGRAELRVPSAWAGIWSVNDTTVDCTTGRLLATSSYLDTLCAGDTTYLYRRYLTFGGAIYPTCTGVGFTDTGFDLSCTIGGVPCGYMGTCSATYTDAEVWTRDGDNATTTLTHTWSYSGPALPPPTSGCTYRTGTRTRIASSDAAHCPAPPPVDAALDIDPAVLNVNSNAHWLTAHITPPAPFAADQINISSLLLNGVPFAPEFAIRTEADNSLRVRFDRRAVAATLTPGDSVPVTLVGTVGDDERPFQAVAYIAVRGALMAAPQPGAYAAGSSVAVSWPLPATGVEPTVTLLSTFDDGLTWNVEAEGLANTGSTTWNAPASTVPSARLAIAYVLLYDETGPVNRTEYAVSSPFSIVAPAGAPVRSYSYALREVVPQPSHGTLRVSFSLPDDTPARLEILDLAGRRIAGQKVGALGGGLHQIEFGRGQRLPPGVYVVRLTRAGVTRTGRAVVIW